MKNKGKIEAMETELTKLKCRDCEHCRIFHGVTTCMLHIIHVAPDSAACICVLPKLSARERRECLTK